MLPRCACSLCCTAFSVLCGVLCTMCAADDSLCNDISSVEVLCVVYVCMFPVLPGCALYIYIVPCSHTGVEVNFSQDRHTYYQEAK